jgi:chromosomal replication initiation ATPase DnaA
MVILAHADQLSLTTKEFKIQSKDVLFGSNMDHKLHLALLVIEDLACRRSGVSLEAMLGSVRGQAHVVFARHICLYLVHQYLAGSITATAAAVGRDRRMVAYAIGRIEERRDSDPAFDRTLDLYLDEACRLIANAQSRFALRLSSPPLPTDLAHECLSHPTIPTCTASWHG